MGSSRHKFLNIAPLEIYSHALKENKNIIHVTFVSGSNVDWFQITNCFTALPWVTSISFGSQPTLLAMHRGIYQICR